MGGHQQTLRDQFFIAWRNHIPELPPFDLQDSPPELQIWKSLYITGKCMSYEERS